MQSQSNYDSSQQHPAQSDPPAVTKVFQVTIAKAQPQPASERPEDIALLGMLAYHEARKEAISAFERLYIRALLDRCGGNVSHSARVAGVDRVYLHRLLRKHEMSSSKPRPRRVRSEVAPKIDE